MVEELELRWGTPPSDGWVAAVSENFRVGAGNLPRRE